MPKRKRSAADPLARAREAARAEVARRWPELAGIEPSVTQRVRAEGAGSAGPAPLADADGPEYTFTFAGHTHTPDGYTMPRIARVTIDARRRVVKATASK